MKKYKAEELIKSLKVKYKQSQRYSVFEQVANGTGLGTNSWIDAVVVSLWPSDGNWRAAYEVKVSRGDFLKELSNPQKNQWAKDSFNEFWYIAPSGVIKDVNELPENCGWLKPHGDKLSVVRAASRRNVEMNESLFLSLARSSSRNVEEHVKERMASFKEQDSEYIKAKKIEDAVVSFLAKRSQRVGYDPSKDEIIRMLEGSTRNEELNKDIYNVQSVASNFQLNISRLVDDVVKIAYLGLNEIDELGNTLSFMRDSKQGESELSIARLRAIAVSKKDSGVPLYTKMNAKKVVETFDFVNQMKENKDK